MIYFKKRQLNLNELKFHGCTQYLGSKLSIEIIHIMGQIGIAEGPFLIIPGLKVGMVQINFSLLQDALFHLKFRNR